MCILLPSLFCMPFSGVTCHIEAEDTQFWIPSPHITQVGRRSRVTYPSILRKLVYLTSFIVWYSVFEFLTAMPLKIQVIQDVPLCDSANDSRRFEG